MTTEHLPAALLIGSLVVLVSVLGVRFAGRLGVPGLFLYLLIGLTLGTVFPSLHVEDPDLAVLLGYSALVLILAQGGLTTRMSALRPVLWPSILLATVGVAVSVVVVAMPLIWWFGLSPQVAILIGAALSATDAAAVFSITRRMRLSGRLSALLEAEAGFNDAPLIVLVSIVASDAFATVVWWHIPLLVAAELVGGAIVGIAVGYGARWLLPRLALPAVGLYPIAALALIVVAYSAASLAHASGFIAVYVAAVLIGSTPRLPHRRSTIGFADALGWIAEIGLFVMLGALAELSELPAAIPVAIVVVLLLGLLARPASILVSLAPFRIPRREMAFASTAGLRGAVPIVFAAIPLAFGVADARLVFDVTLIVVLLMLVIQPTLLGRIGRRLGVVDEDSPTELSVDSAPLDDVNAVMLGVEVPAESGLVGVFVSELGLPDGAVVSLVVRGRTAIAPDVHTRLRAGDRVLVVATASTQGPTQDRLEEVAAHGRLARWLDGPI